MNMRRPFQSQDLTHYGNSQIAGHHDLITLQLSVCKYHKAEVMINEAKHTNIGYLNGPSITSAMAHVNYFF